MTSKSQRNEEGEQEARRDTARKRLDEVKSNLEELEEVNKEGLTNLELKLTEAFSSLHREFKTLKRQVDETATAGVAGPVTVRDKFVTLMKPYFEDVEDEGRGQTGRAQIFITPPAVDKQIEAIIDHQLVRGKGWNNSSSQFLVHWKGTVCGARVVAKSGGGACTAPQGATLNSSNSGGEADSSCASAGLKQHIDYFPAFREDLETLEGHVAAMTYSQKGSPSEGTRVP
uniref:Uncharacterized protein n=1 Tax=Solanum tuberosum TaxID=4113 RepID=M1DUP0_SOLTU